MEIELINKIVKTTALLVILSSLLAGIYRDITIAFEICLAGAFVCLNVISIRFLVESFMTKSSKKIIKIFLLLFMKFPFLYFSAYILLINSWLSVYHLIYCSFLLFLALLSWGLKEMIRPTTGIVTCATGCLLLLNTEHLFASVDAEVPEVPNILTLAYKLMHSPLTNFLHVWENVIFSLIVSLALSVVFLLAANKKELIPKGLQNAVEYVVEILRRFVRDILGKDGDKYVPLLGTLFIFILSMNWLALVPFMKPPTSSINITIALAICVFFLVQYLNFKNWGFLGFLYHMAGSPKGFLGWALVPLMLPIEILTQLTRPLTLALRLFGNIAGEDILIGAAAIFGVYLLSSSGVWAGLPMQLPFMFLALLTGLMQALVFTLLSAIYILLSMPSHENDHSE